MTHPLLRFVADKVAVQTAVYWGAPSPNGTGGYTYSTAVEINCRWDDSTEMIKTSDGKEVISRAEVTLVQDVDEGGFLYLGTLDDLTEAQRVNPLKVSGAFEILRFDKNPLFGSTSEFVRGAFL